MRIALYGRYGSAALVACVALAHAAGAAPQERDPRPFNAGGGVDTTDIKAVVVFGDEPNADAILDFWHAREVPCLLTHDDDDALERERNLRALLLHLGLTPPEQPSLDATDTPAAPDAIEAPAVAQNDAVAADPAVSADSSAPSPKKAARGR